MGRDVILVDFIPIKSSFTCNPNKIKYRYPRLPSQNAWWKEDGPGTYEYIHYRSELVDEGGVDVGRYDSSCTHVIVSGRVFVTRNDRKILVTELWIDDGLDIGMPADSTKVLYRPVRDLSGIPGSKSLHICLTGYQKKERDDIMVYINVVR
ncbi:BRCT domain-containing protein [Platanthera guangdongensis]|uniref:BRCT domain-containing protein n=1 Tax=Platanthera guangdongensis TaxID=2320717 RepID=A0ABR2MC53_9ASPA